MIIKGVLRKVENFESNTDRKFVVSVNKEDCPDDILKYQHEAVSVNICPSETPEEETRLEVLISIRNAALKLAEIAEGAVQEGKP